MTADIIDLVRTDPLASLSNADLAASAASAIRAASRVEAAGDTFEALERERTAIALARLDELYEPIRQRRDHLDVGLSRITGLRATMVARLDALSADADLEPNGDIEPSLGFPEPGIRIMDRGAYHVLSQERLHAFLPIDHEDREEEDEHDEASLCGVTFGTGDIWDREDEHNGREPDVEDEPSLSAPENLDQGNCWFVGTDRDLEAQCEDEGAESGDREPEDY